MKVPGAMNQERELGRHVHPGEFVFREGDAADCFFVVQEGSLAGVFQDDGHQTSLVRYEKGEIFGENPLLTSSKTRLFSVRALEESRVLRVDERLFLEKLHLDPSFAFRVMRHMAQRIEDLELEKRHQLIGKAIQTTTALARPPAPRPVRQVHDFSVGYHVLLVEDDEEFCQLVHRWLSKVASDEENPILPANFQLTCSNSLEKSLQLLSRDKYDTILLDLNLPDSFGMATLHRIASLVRDTPIVVLSADDDEEEVLHAVEDGAQDYLIKSHVTGNQVAQAIRFARMRHLNTLHQRHGTALGHETEKWFKKIGSVLGLG